VPNPPLPSGSPPESHSYLHGSNTDGSDGEHPPESVEQLQRWRELTADSRRGQRSDHWLTDVVDSASYPGDTTTWQWLVDVERRMRSKTGWPAPEDAP